MRNRLLASQTHRVTKPEHDRDIYIQTVVDLRRGVDLTRNSLTKEQQENYFTTLSSVDPIRYIGYVAPSALFLQFGKKDRYPSEEMQVLYAQAASNPKLVKLTTQDTSLMMKREPTVPNGYESKLNLAS